MHHKLLRCACFSLSMKGSYVFECYSGKTALVLHEEHVFLYSTLSDADTMNAM